MATRRPVETSLRGEDRRFLGVGGTQDGVFGNALELARSVRGAAERAMDQSEITRVMSGNDSLRELVLAMAQIMLAGEKATGFQLAMLSFLRQKVTAENEYEERGAGLK